ncbi:hypothetical protein DOA20_26610 [Salmonella enterica subsp. enterica serovar Newport]|nr:hypothetical protein [Salmonella enterica subsp. enterica serovar Newport]
MKMTLNGVHFFESRARKAGTYRLSIFLPGPVFPPETQAALRTGDLYIVREVARPWRIQKAKTGEMSHKGN